MYAHQRVSESLVQAVPPGRQLLIRKCIRWVHESDYKSEIDAKKLDPSAPSPSFSKEMKDPGGAGTIFLFGVVGVIT